LGIANINGTQAKIAELGAIEVEADIAQRKAEIEKICTSVIIG